MSCTIAQLQAYYLPYSDLLYFLSLEKLTHALMGVPYFNLTVVAKLEEMGVVAEMQKTCLK
jgi:hypothetical protein